MFVNSGAPSWPTAWTPVTVHVDRQLPLTAIGTRLGRPESLPAGVGGSSMANVAMTSPARKPVAPPEATQELQALDVVEIVQTPLAPSTRDSGASNSSIAPVGLDLRPRGQRAAAADEEVNPTMEIRLPLPRRRLGVVVVGTLTACALILVAAGVARVVHASSGEPGAAAAPPTNAAVAAATAPASLSASTPASTASVAAPPSAPPASTSGGASTGTVRLDRPAYPGHVWLDGKKLSSSSSMVSCGTHQIKVGFRRTHSIDVPCGGELGVSK
jgi:hypothetical protein